MARAKAAKAEPAPVIEYSLELALKICERFGEGESLREIGADEAMPAKSTILKWIAQHEEFRTLYDLAFDARADTDAEEVGEIKRRVLSGNLDPQAARVAIEALKWSAGVRAPKKYGPKMDVNHGGGIAMKLEIDNFGLGPPA